MHRFKCKKTNPNILCYAFHTSIIFCLLKENNLVQNINRNNVVYRIYPPRIHCRLVKFFGRIKGLLCTVPQKKLYFTKELTTDLFLKQLYSSKKQDRVNSDDFG